MYDKINDFINNNITPKLLTHFGDMRLISYNNGIVEISMLGACKNCPSANSTLVDLIEPTLKSNFPEIKSVICVNETSEELLQFAKNLLSKNKKGNTK